MPIDPNADAEITAFRWVPPFAAGLVRDLRIRWALEEIGRPYRGRLLDALKPRPPEYFLEQPFGQPEMRSRMGASRRPCLSSKGSIFPLKSGR